jgi:hypothetical protein
MDAIYFDFGYVGEIQNLWLFPQSKAGILLGATCAMEEL